MLHTLQLLIWWWLGSVDAAAFGAVQIIKKGRYVFYIVGVLMMIGGYGMLQWVTATGRKTR